MSAKKILVVDDDEKIGLLLTDILSEAGFLVAVAPTTEDAWEKVIHLSPDLILLDLEVPEKGGMQFCREVKEKEPYRGIAVIFITVRDREMDIATGLNLGADDFIVKPFSPNELIARINVSIRRSEQIRKSITQVQSGDLTVDFDKRLVLINSKPVHLTPKEFDLLRVLYMNRNRVMKDKEIFSLVWGTQCDTFSSTVYTHLNRLRKKLGDHGVKIRTIPGSGFRFDERMDGRRA